VLSLEQEIAGEPSKPGDLPRKEQGDTNPREEQADHDEQFAYIGKIEHLRATSGETEHRSCDAVDYES